MRKVEGTISSGLTGLPVLHAQVSVLNADTTPAQLYSDNGITPIAQPVLSNGLGYWSFYIADGTYTRIVANPDGSNPITFSDEEMYEDARNVSVPVGEAAVSLPSIGARMGRVAAYDSAGAPIAIDGDTIEAAQAAAVAAIEAAEGESVADIATARDAAIATVASTPGASVYPSLTAALAAIADGQYASVLQSAGYATDTYLRASGSLGLVATTPIGVGFTTQTRMGLQGAPLTITQPPLAPVIAVYGMDGHFTDGMFVPNRMGPAPVRHFQQSASSVTPSSSETVTYGTADPWGGLTGLRIQQPNNLSTAVLVDVNSAAVPSELGSYRIRFYARSHAGAGNQSFKLRAATGSPAYTTAVTEGAWVLVDQTFTFASSSNISIYNENGFGTYPLDIDITMPVVTRPEVVTPIPPVQATGALVDSRLSRPGNITVDANDNIVAPYKGRMKFADNGVTARTFTAMTMVVTFKQTAAGSSFNAPFYARPTNSPTSADIGLGCSGNGFFFSMPGLSRAAINASMTPVGDQFVAVAQRWDATRSDGALGSIIYSDSASASGAGTGGTGVPLAVAWFGGGGYNDSSPLTGLINSIQIYDQYLTDEQLSQAIRHGEDVCALSGNTVGMRNIVFTEGDSIAAGTGATSPDTGYATKSAVELGVKQFRYAVAGAQLGTAANTTGNYLFARLPTLLAQVVRCVRDGKRAIVTTAPGVNGTLDFTAYQSYIDQLRAAGALVIRCTITSSSSNDATITATNTGIRALTSDGLADFASNVNIGAVGAWSNATYFPDGLHPSQAGHDIMEAIIKPVIAGLLI